MGVISTGDAVAESLRIQRPTGVDVLFAEVGVAVEDSFRRALRSEQRPHLVAPAGVPVICCTKPGQWFLRLRARR